MRLWGGRFGEGPDSRMADFTRSIEVDAELARMKAELGSGAPSAAQLEQGGAGQPAEGGAP